MRAFFVLMILAGAALGLAYPWAVTHLVGREIGMLQVYSVATGYRTIEKRLSPSDAPLRVLVDMRIVGGLTPPDGQSVLAVTVVSDGRTVLAKPLTFVEATLTDRSPQTNERVYRDDAGLITSLDEGIYRFAVQPGDDKDLHVQSVKIILLAGAWSVNQMVRMLGFLLMAAGLAGLVLAVRRHRRLQWEGQSIMAGQDRDDGDRA